MDHLRILRNYRSFTYLVIIKLKTKININKIIKFNLKIIKIFMHFIKIYRSLIDYLRILRNYRSFTYLAIIKLKTKISINKIIKFNHKIFKIFVYFI